MSGTLLQSVLWLEAAEGRLGDLVAEYRRVGVIEAARPFGLRQGEAVTIEGDDRTLLVTSVWSTPGSYDDWLASAERERVTLGVWPLLAAGVEQRIERRQVQEDTLGSPIEVASLVGDRPVERVIVVEG